MEEDDFTPEEIAQITQLVRGSKSPAAEAPVAAPEPKVEGPMMLDENAMLRHNTWKDIKSVIPQSVADAGNAVANSGVAETLSQAAQGVGQAIFGKVPDSQSVPRGTPQQFVRNGWIYQVQADGSSKAVRKAI